MVAGEPDVYGVDAGIYVRPCQFKVQGPVRSESRVGCKDSIALAEVVVDRAAFCDIYFFTVCFATVVVPRLNVHIVKAVWHFDVVGMPPFSGFHVVVPHQPRLRLYRHTGRDGVIQRLAAQGAVRGNVQIVAHLDAAQLVCRSGRQGVRRAELGIGLVLGIPLSQGVSGRLCISRRARYGQSRVSGHDNLCVGDTLCSCFLAGLCGRCTRRGSSLTGRCFFGTGSRFLGF